MTFRTAGQVPRKTLVTMSWDDGHPADVKVADLMARYGIKGTFYVPVTNREGLPVMSSSELHQVGVLHEIGSHTYSHRYLTEATPAEARQEIVAGKSALEDALGRPVDGFCYPGGTFDMSHMAMVRESGFGYARGNVSYRTDLRFDQYRMPTTLQVFPHRRDVYLRNFFSQGEWRRRALVMARVVMTTGLLARLIACFEAAHASSSPTVVHLWGHSWELERLGGWSQLEALFRYLTMQADVAFVENRDVARAVTC